MRILVVEDHATLAQQLRAALEDSHFTVDAAPDGEEAVFLGETEPYDAVVLDLGLPKLDGLSVLRRWRSAGRTMPVLILTARDAWTEKVAGLNAGADDYLTKPFMMPELVARIQAQANFSCGLSGLDETAQHCRHIPLRLTGPGVAFSVQLDAVGADLGREPDLVWFRVHEQTGADTQ